MPDPSISSARIPTWTTVASAAAAMEIHPRTVERRVASGKIQSRRSESGQIEVLVNLPQQPEPAADPFAVVADQATAQVQLATAASSALVQQSRAEVDRAYGELTLARTEAVRARRSSTFAWVMVAMMAGVSCAAVAWTTHKLTRDSDDLRVMDDRVRQEQAAADRVQIDKELIAQDRDQIRAELVRAKVAQANAEGQVSAMNNQPVKANKNPGTLFQRLAVAFGAD